MPEKPLDKHENEGDQLSQRSRVTRMILASREARLGERRDRKNVRQHKSIKKRNVMSQREATGRKLRKLIEAIT